MKTKRIIIFFFVFALATITPGLYAENIALKQSGNAYQLKRTSGPFRTVEIKAIQLHDAKRGKTLALRVCYPMSSETCPVIIFSHGNGSSKDSYPNVGPFFASHGFIWIQPTHSDSMEYWDHQTSQSEWLGRTFTDPNRWSSRPKDISFILDSIDRISDAMPGTKPRFDMKRVAVAGHSFGGNTAQLIGDAKHVLKPGGRLVGYKDSRVRAIISGSGAGRGWVGMIDGSWADLKIPMLAITGTRDFGPEGRNFDFRMEAFLFCPPGNKYQLIVENMGHGFPYQPKQFEIVGATMLTFLDAYLNDNPAAKQFLKSERLTEMSSNTAILSWR